MPTINQILPSIFFAEFGNSTEINISMFISFPGKQVTHIAYTPALHRFIESTKHQYPEWKIELLKRRIGRELYFRFTLPQ